MSTVAFTLINKVTAVKRTFKEEDQEGSHMNRMPSLTTKPVKPRMRGGSKSNPKKMNSRINYASSHSDTGNPPRAVGTKANENRSKRKSMSNRKTSMSSSMSI